jgi:hypothetical protein
MCYSCPQSFVNKVRTWPEYYEMLEIIREKDVDVDRIIELFKELYRRGNIFKDWKCNENSLCFVLTCVKYHDAE